jgi:hypothetical protein
MVQVRVFGAQWEHLAPGLEIDLAGRKVVVADLLAALGVDPADVGIVTVDGRQSKLDDSLPAAGRVCIFPPMMGG